MREGLGHSINVQVEEKHSSSFLRFVTSTNVIQSGGVEIDYVVYLINYIFGGGPQPCGS